MIRPALACVCLALAACAPTRPAPDERPVGGFDLEPLWVRLGDTDGAIDEERGVASIEAAEFSPDGRYIVSAAKRAGDVRVWDAETGEQLWNRFHENDPDDEVEVVGWTPDGRYAVSGGEDHRVRVWTAADGEFVRALRHTASIDGMRFSNGGGLLAAGDEAGKVYVWDTSADDPRDWPDTPRFVLEQGRDTGDEGAGLVQADINSIDWSADDRFLVTAGRNGLVKRWEVTRLGEPDGGLVMVYEGFDDSIKSVRISPDGALVAAGGQNSPDALALVWDYETGAVVARLDLPTSPKYEAVEWTPDGRFLLTGGVEGFDVEQDGEGMQAVAYKYEMGDGVGHIRAFDRERGFALAHRERVYRQEYFHFNADGSRLVGSHGDGTLRLFRVVR